MRVRRSGRCRAIGVSNYQQRHLQELLDVAEVKPMVNQARLVPPPSQNSLSSLPQLQRARLPAPPAMIRCWEKCMRPLHDTRSNHAQACIHRAGPSQLYRGVENMPVDFYLT